jgi:hypothetical protein
MEFLYAAKPAREIAPEKILDFWDAVLNANFWKMVRRIPAGISKGVTRDAINDFFPFSFRVPAHIYFGIGD